MLNIIHTFICLGIFWTSFSRAILMNEETKIEIALCMSFMGTMGLGLAISPLAWGTCISAPIVFFEGSVLIVQVVTARLWSAGIPHEFKR